MNSLARRSIAVDRDLDMLAEVAKANLSCDMVFISVSKHEKLYSIGLDLNSAQNESNRIHRALDTICGETVRRNETVLLSNATATPHYRDISYVSKSPFVAYLGVPLRIEELGPYGAICAISKKARKWTRNEKRFLEQLATVVSSLVAKEIQKDEIELLHEAVRETDLVLMTLAAEIFTPVSIHDAEGTLLFASLGLTRLATEEAVSDAGRQLVEAISAERSRNESAVAEQAGRSTKVGTSLTMHNGVLKKFEAYVVETCNAVYFVSWPSMETATIC